jgi:hypothetical protein
MRWAVTMGLALALLPTGGAGAQPDAGDREAARAAFLDGNAEFKLGHWQAAAAAWERGYELKADPLFLYNIAQAYRLADVRDKALFFYRSYLRDAPDAPNRAYVVERVAQLERAVDTRAPAPPAATATGSTLGGATATRTRTRTRTSVTVAAPERRERLDVEAEVGLATWAAGVPSGTSPSLLVALGAGYTPLERPRLQLRVGALVTYTFLREAGATDHFVTLLADPMLRVRLWRQRLFLDGELGFGVQIAAGLAAGSPLLVPQAAGGTRAAFTLRPSLALELRVAPRFAVRAALALGYSPMSDFASPSLVRVELALGAVLRW